MLCDDSAKSAMTAMGTKRNAEVSGTTKCVAATNDIKAQSNFTEMQDASSSGINAMMS